MCQNYKGHIVLGLDARDGKVATEGWLETSATLAVDLVQGIAKHTTDCVAVVYTDIARDGMMSGPNFEQLLSMQQASPFPVIASGGVTTLEDVDQLVAMNTHGAIIGKTLYEGKITCRMFLSELAKRLTFFNGDRFSNPENGKLETEFFRSGCRCSASKRLSLSPNKPGCLHDQIESDSKAGRGQPSIENERTRKGCDNEIPIS